MKLPIAFPTRRGTEKDATRLGSTTPQWVRYALAGTILLAGGLYLWDAFHAGYSDYYATAARSMSMSWRAFFFGSFDPSATITLDKLSGFLVPQALSARLLGFSAFSIALPQVLEGLITIGFTFLIVRRWVGPIGGLLAAVFTAFTPVMVTTFTHSMEDGALTMCVVLAVWAWQQAIDTGRVRFLLIAGALVGLGFQAKMIQAWLILPALCGVYFCLSTKPAWQKIRDLLATLATTVAVSLSWMTAIALSPARPYIDGTTDNNIFTMVFGYNGINRFFSNAYPGALKSAAVSAGTGSSVGLIPEPWSHLPIKFFFAEYATQVGWLYPLAGAGILLGIISIRRHSPWLAARTDGRTGVIVSVSLLSTFVIVLGVMSLPHTAYLASMVLPISALAAIGVVLLARVVREHVRALRWVFPTTAALQTGWTIFLVSHYPTFSGWLVVPTALVAIASVAVLIATRHRLRRVSLVVVASTAALVAAFAGPLFWSASTVNIAYAGTSNDAYAGPPVASVTKAISSQESLYGVGLDSNSVSEDTVETEKDIYEYAAARGGSERFALATGTWRSAAPFIMSGRGGILPIGGYTGRVPSPTVAQLRTLVETRQLTFVLLTGSASSADLVNTTMASLPAWVVSRCTLVPRISYAPDPTKDDDVTIPDRLYRC